MAVVAPFRALQRCRLVPLIVFLAAALFPAAAVDRLVIETPLVSPADRASSERVLSLLDKAALLANRTYNQWIEVLPPGTNISGEYRVSVVAALEDNPAVVLAMKAPGPDGAERTFALLESPGAETVHYLSRALYFLWASHQEALRRPRGHPPELLDELPVEAVAESLLPGMSAALMPFSAAATGRGSLLLGLSLMAVELDRSFRVVRELGRSLYENGVMGFAQSLTVTAEGTLFLKPAMGGDMYRWSVMEPTAEPQKIRLRGTPYGPLAALPDGSVALLNTMDRRLWRIEGERVREVPLRANPDAWPTAMAAGPEGTLWIYYPVERRIKVHAPGGELLDSILPLMDYGHPLEATAMAVYPDGRFLMYGRQGLWCFDRRGLPLWHLEQLPSLVPGGSPEPLPQQASLALDVEIGVLYLTDLTGRRVLKLLDTDYCREFDIQPKLELELLELNRRQQAAPGDAEASTAKAALYEEAGALEMALVQWERVLEIDPGNRTAAQRRTEVERKLARAAAVKVRDRAIASLERIGRETARPVYQEAMRLYEKLVARYPQDTAARREMSELRERFETAGGALGAGGGEQALAVEQVEAENLFPALMQEYHRRPVLRLELRNTSERSVRNLQAEIFVERFMDFPSQSRPVAVLNPGARVTLELKVPLNGQVLELEENLPVQGRVEVSYRLGSAGQKLRCSVGFTIYRRTALRWDDSGKLGSFVTPNEGIVSSFALRVSNTERDLRYRLSNRLLRAVRICDALGAYGIRYVEDPDSPISRVLEQREAVDTVRFARQTLQVRSGDCDDTTALLASLLEAAGIRTAVVTTPGHVLLAFDSGEGASSAWLLEGRERAVVVRDGSAWLPVETTVLSEGFMTAWIAGSRLYRRHVANGEVEFLSLQELRERYPPIPLPASNLPVAEPTDAEIDALFDGTLQYLEDKVYGEQLRTLEQELAAEGGKAVLRLANRIGILHGVFGRDEAAVSSFQRLLNDHPEFQPAALNLAKLRIDRGELAAAEEVLRKALLQDGDSPAVNLLLAQLYHHRSDRRRVQEHFRVVERRSPELAARYGYLSDDGQAAAPRAGISEPAVPFWE